MYKNKKLTIITTILFFLLFGLMMAENNYEFKTLMELKFDKEIEDVAFDSYEENGQIKFYPKIVVLREVDPDASSGSVVNYALEVRILDRKWKVIKKIPNLKFFSRVHFSKKGKYFGIERVTFKDPLVVYNEREILSADFTVYDDKGRKKWKIEGPLEYNFPHILSCDGSVFLSLSSEGLLGALGLDHFNRKGNRKSIIPLPRDLYSGVYKNIQGVLLSDDGKFVIVTAQIERQKPHPIVEQLVLSFYDSQGNLLWENPIKEGAFGETALSPKGSYVNTDCYTWASEPDISKERIIKEKLRLVPPQMKSANVLIFNHEGKLIKKIPIRISTTAVAFSPNEQFLHFCDYKVGEDDILVLLNLQTNEEMFRKKVPRQTLWAKVSNDGVVLIYNSLFSQIYLINKNGDIITENDISEENAKDFRFLGWNGNDPIFGTIQKLKIVKIFSFAER